MSSKERSGFASAEDFPSLFRRGAEFARELLDENQRLRNALAMVADRQESAARNPADWEKLRRELLERISSLQEECTSVRERLDQVERENQQFAQRYVEVEEENNNLANLYVASYQLHSTLDLDEVLKTIQEIAINLVGAEVFAIYLLDEETSALVPVQAEGLDRRRFPTAKLGEDAFGSAAARSETTCWEIREGLDPERPIVCVPLHIGDRTIGAISIYRLLSQKKGAFSALDRELFNMLGGHAATAIFAAKLYSQSERKLNTIQSFIDLLTK